MNKDLNTANLNNLFFISKVLRNITHFVFFGTLLGLTRDGQLIDGDFMNMFLIKIISMKDGTFLDYLN
jgi:hypothetical protein